MTPLTNPRRPPSLQIGERNMLKEFRTQIKTMIAKARENENYMDLAGLSEGDLNDGEQDAVTFATIKSVLEEGLKNLEEEKNHVHDFKTESGMCSGCTADGNA